MAVGAKSKKRSVFDFNVGKVAEKIAVVGIERRTDCDAGAVGW